MTRALGESEPQSAVMGEENPIHVLVVAFPSQGHVNPVLRLAKRLASKGLLLTFSSTEEIGFRMQKLSNTKPPSATPIGKGKLRFEFFSDGCDLNDPNRHDINGMMDRLNRAGPQAVEDLIARQASEGRPLSFVITNPFLPWVLDVATDAGIPCGLLWVQSCAVFSAYYHYCNDPKIKYPAAPESEVSVQLPGMPPLSPDDVPSFILETNPYKCLTEVMVNQFKNMSKASWVMVDSFMELERPIIESLEEKGASLLPVGPLVKSIQGFDSSSVRAEMWKASDCLEWLDKHPPASVVYVSFGSVVLLGKEQMKEMEWGIRNSGRPFLWVVKPRDDEELELPEGFLEGTEGKGLAVPWCPQEEVLSHPSVACFLTHCGWNSTMESLCSGVPVVGFPQWGDQVTNAKFLADVFGVGVRLRPEKGSLVGREQVERCIAEVTDGGPRAEETKKAALKWKEAAAEAVAGGGSSDRNIQAFVDEIKQKAADSVDVSKVTVVV